MRMMIERLGGRLATDATLVVPTELVVRSSTAPAKPNGRVAATQ
jgi:LacI family repressor for deo operon, udp, cdd, tsx, nupC, and nupG